MQAHKVVSTDAAPKAIGPYSQATSVFVRQVGKTVFCSGQIPLVPETGRLVGDEVGAQTRQVLENLAAVLKADGLGLEHVVKTTVYLKDLGEFQAMNEVYASFFPERPPARATVEVARLPRDARVEIDCIAVGPLF